MEDDSGVPPEEESAASGAEEEPFDGDSAEPEEQVKRVREALTELDRVSPLTSARVNAAMQSWLAQTAGVRAANLDGISQALRQVAWTADVPMKRISDQILKSFTPLNDSLIRAMEGWLPDFRSLSNPRLYATGPAPKATYSPDMSSPGAYFQKHEIVIESFEGLNQAIVALISKAESLQLVWRGQQDANWAMNSSLYRRLKVSNGVKDPGAKARGAQPFPTEDQMVSAETEILRVAREDWRLDGLSALETFARIQHAGGMSRLIDVTKNPFIGAWFACEENVGTDSKDARLFAFATTPPLSDSRNVPGVQISLDRDWSGHLPPWHLWEDAETRRDFDWGTGSRRRLWVPPNYDSRIAAQNAAFLIDGVPLPTKSASYFPSPSGYWTHADILAAGSIYMKTAQPARKPRSNMHNFAPTFTFRITASAKSEIRNILTERFGYTTSYIYPDVAKLAERVRSMELPKRDGLG